MAPPALQPRHVSPEEYLALERAAPCKSEYWFGEIFAMAGAAPPHVQIQANVMLRVYAGLQPPCRIYGSDLKIGVLRRKIGVHRRKPGFADPGATVICLRHQDRAFAGLYARQPDGSWLLRELTASDALSFEPLREPIPLSHFCDQVDFDWTNPPA